MSTNRFTKIYLVDRIRAGLHTMRIHPMRVLLPVTEIIIFFVIGNRTNNVDSLSFFLICMFFLIVTIFLMGIPFKTYKFNEGFKNAGFDNHMGEIPVLISVAKDHANPAIRIYELLAVGIPYSEWEAKKTELEAALNVCIISIDTRDGNKRIVLKAVDAVGALPKRVEWDENFLPNDVRKLVLGIGSAGRVEINLSTVPHILVGGSTGSGKTVLIQGLTHQALRHGMEVLLCDFKGVDFTCSRWNVPNCTKVLTVESLIDKLQSVIELINYRRGGLQVTGRANIDEFNKTQDKSFQWSRYLIVIDEVAEVLDTTGATKEQKAQIAEIISMLSTIARQGRAFGIHLLLGTQRPDANILPGQIKNNIDCRICGKADNVLSMIILDSTDAAEIPKTSQGRFLMADGTMFQAFYFHFNKGEEKSWIR